MEKIHCGHSTGHLTVSQQAGWSARVLR